MARVQDTLEHCRSPFRQDRDARATDLRRSPTPGFLFRLVSIRSRGKSAAIAAPWIHPH